MKEKNERVKLWTGLVFLFAILLLTIATIVFLTEGKSTIINQENIVENSKALTCEKSDVQYPLLTEDIGKGTLKINFVFKNDRLSIVSLVYKVHYDDVSQIERNEVKTRIQMTENFSKDGLGSEALGVVFSALENALQLSLYANANEINGVTAKYFLLDDLNDLYKQKTMRDFYTEKGFDCQINS